MALERGAGVLVHPSSFPGGEGIGDLGEGADRFIDYLDRADLKYWQLLPLGPINASGSPYQTLSSFAGNTYLISLDLLGEYGLLSRTDVMGYKSESKNRVDYQNVRKFKAKRFKVAFDNFNNDKKSLSELHDDFAEFKEKNSDWLDDFALFVAIKSKNGEKAWWQWDDKSLIMREAKAIAKAKNEFSYEIDLESWLQFLFDKQWTRVKNKANIKGIKIIGDLPIYTAHDSADVWAGRELFEVDPETGEALLMAGAPPDYFCEDGQLWGNPIYKWELMKSDGYKWWMKRMRAVLSQTDVVRIDHFRGFQAYWQVEAGQTTAKNGAWITGPGQDFFDALLREFKSETEGEFPLIAEDLGVITPEVEALRDDNNLPGMKILQFAFCDGANFYRPHAYDKNCVVYTGTHDNDTSQGWYKAEGGDYAHMGRDIIDAERDLCRRYIGIDGSNIHWDFIKLAMMSTADVAIFPVQDIMGLGNEARMNRPGIGEGNWRWRMLPEQLDNLEVWYINSMNFLYDRGRQDVEEESEA